MIDSAIQKLKKKLSEGLGAVSNSVHQNVRVAGNVAQGIGKDITDSAGRAVMRYEPITKANDALWQSKVGQGLADFQQSSLGKTALGLKNLYVDQPVQFGQQMGRDFQELAPIVKESFKGNLPSLGYNPAKAQSALQQGVRGLGIVSSAIGPTNPNAVLGYMGLSGAMDYGVNRYQGMDHRQALNSGINAGIESLPKAINMAGVTKFTNPIISNTTKGMSPFVKYPTLSALNVGEGLIIDQATGLPTTKESMAIDAIFPLASEAVGVVGKKIFKSANEAMRAGKAQVLKSMGKSLRNNKGLFTTMDKYTAGTRAYVRRQNPTAYAVAGVEPYQDEQGNWKVRFNPDKALLGMGIGLGVKNNVKGLDDAIRGVNPKGGQVDSLYNAMRASGNDTRPAHQAQIEDLIKAGKFDEAWKVVDSMADTDQYKKPMENLLGMVSPKVETPRIDRTKLTGLQLETPNAKLKAYQKPIGELQNPQTARIPIAQPQKIEGMQPQDTIGQTKSKLEADVFGGNVDSQIRNTNIQLNPQIPQPSQVNTVGNQQRGSFENILTQAKKKIGEPNMMVKRSQKVPNQVGEATQRLPKQGEVVVEQSLGNSNVLGKNQVQPMEAVGSQKRLGQMEQVLPIQANDNQITWQQLGSESKPSIETQKITPKTVSSKGIISPEVEREVKNVQNAVKSKVNLLDYIRTPDRVLEKIGLKSEANLIKNQYNSYLDQLPKEIDRVTAWYNRVKSNKGVEKRIFQYLDGQDVKLEGEELKVAIEMQKYLKDWADKLDLPEDKRVTHYITHIFEKDFIQKEFDPDLAKILSGEVPGSVYDPFLQQRLGKMGFVEDAFRALDAYVKRATRKYNMDPALKQLDDASNGLDLASWQYVKSYADRINMRPTHLDELIDNLVKSSPVGYKLGQRPVANLSRAIRQTTYRGTLGLNIGSAIRNLTQGVNTYAQLGEKYTGIGYMKALRSIMSRDDELMRVGVMRDNFIQDRALSSTKKFWERLDKRLFMFFETAEKINRGSAYFGAKARALSRGATEAQAIKEGVEMARKTQFTFGSVDTPVALQSDVAKLLTQFQSFNVKQTEFLAEMAKKKEYAGLVRWLGANAVLLFTVGQTMGWDWKDFVPFGGVLEGRTPIGGTPAFQLGIDTLKASTGAPDQYGNPIGWDTVAKDVVPFIPAGVQGKKTIEGLGAYNQGYSASKSGLVRYPIEQNASNAIRTGLFGQYNTPEAREYFNKDRTPLSEKQSEVFKSKGKEYYDKVMQNRERNKELDNLKKQMKGEQGFNILDMFKPKDAVASTNMIGDTYLYNSGDEIKELDLSKFNAIPTDAVSKARLDQDRYTKALSVYREDAIPQEDKNMLLEKIGVSESDMAYYDIASDDESIRTLATKQVVGEIQDRDQLISTLEELRKEVNGKAIATNGVLDNLYNEDLITYEERKYLKDILYTSGKKTTKKKKAKAKKIKLGASPQLKYTPIETSKIKISSGGSNKGFSVKPIKIKKTERKSLDLRNFTRALQSPKKKSIRVSK